MKDGKLEELCISGKIRVVDSILSEKKRVNGPTVINPLPPIGSNILILEHIYIEKQCGQRNLYKWRENNPDRYRVYKVKDYTQGIRNALSITNKMVVSTITADGRELTSQIPVTNITCGYYYAKVLEDDELENYKEFREGKIHGKFSEDY